MKLEWVGHEAVGPTSTWLPFAASGVVLIAQVVLLRDSPQKTHTLLATEFKKKQNNKAM